jgi:hypothetical protein
MLEKAATNHREGFMGHLLNEARGLSESDAQAGNDGLGDGCFKSANMAFLAKTQGPVFLQVK